MSGSEHARCPKCTALLAVVGEPCGCIDEQVEMVAIRLYRNYSESPVPWADLDEWKKQTWRVEAEDLLAPGDPHA